MSFSLPKTFFEIYKLLAWIETRWFHCTVKGKKKKKKKPVTNSKPSCVDFFFFTAGILVFITAQLAWQIKIHLCLLNCYLKWLLPTVTVEYYVVIYAFSGNGSIA